MSSLPGWPTDELLGEVLRVPRSTLVGRPDTEVITREGWWQILTPSLRVGLNEIGFVALPEAEVDTALDAALARYRHLGIRPRVEVVPGSAPADLPARLERRGLTRTDIVVLARDTTPLPPSPRPGVTVELVDERTVDEFSRVMAEGWGAEPGPLTEYHRLLLATAHQRLFLARVDGVAAGTAGLAAAERSAYLLGGQVLPAFRRRGAYAALVDARLAWARAHGRTLAFSNARAETSAPLLARLGFVEVCRYPSYSP